MASYYSSPQKSPPKTPKARRSNVSNRSIGGCAGVASPRAAARMSPTTYCTPDGWESKRVFLVYEKPRGDTGDDDNRGSAAPIRRVPGRNQGVWTQGHVAAQSPQEVWVFEMEDVPSDLLDEQQEQQSGPVNGSSNIPKARQRHIHGAWGLKPGGDEADPNDVWFYPPDHRVGPNDRRPDAKPLPRYFTPRGVWCFPLVKKDASEIAPLATGWLGLGETAKVEKLDVAGTWKMLYRQDGLPVETRGPGMKSSTPKSTPTSTPKRTPPRLERMKIVVETLDGTAIPITVFRTDTVDSVKERVWEDEDIPKAEQRLLSPSGKLMDQDKKTLKAYGINDGSKLKLEGFKLRVKQLWDSRTFEIHSLPPDATIASIKDTIESQEGIDRTEQLLSYEEELLKDALTLRDYKIQHGDTLELEEMEVIVVQSDREFTITVRPHDTIKEVKRAIERHEDIPGDYLRFEFLGELLDQDSLTLKDYRVPHLGRLNLQPLEISIRKATGERVLLLVAPTDSIRAVKEKILEKTGIAVSEQRLLLRSELLKDDRTLQEYGVQYGDELNLEGMEIHVRHWKNMTKKYFLDGLISTAAIKDVKEMLEDRYGLPMDDLRLRFGGDLLADDRKSLREYGIVHQSTLDLESMQMTVITPQGKEIYVSAEPKDTIGQLKQRIEANHGIPVDEQRLQFGGKVLKDLSTLASNSIKHGSILTLEAMEIVVKHWDGTSVRLDADPSLTIIDVKDKIETKTGLHRDKQRLIFQGLMLGENHQTLLEYNVKHGDVLELEPMTINVQTPDGRSILLQVETTDSIGGLKTKIEKDTQIPSGHQRLVHDKRNLDDDKNTMGDYLIKHGSIVIMQPMDIQIRTPDGKSISVQVVLDETIASVKEQLEQLEGLRPEDQRLLLNGKELQDTKTLSDYGIKHGSTLDLGGMQIYIKHFNGNTLTLPVVPTHVVSDVKEMVQDSEGTPADHQYYIFGTKLLEEDSRTLSDYKIRHGSTLKLESMKVYIESPTGKFPLAVEPCTAIHELKRMVEKKTTLAPKDQIILFKGERLSSDDATLSECDVKHRDTILVDLINPQFYKILLGDYQSAFSYNPSPKKKREGARVKRTQHPMGDFYDTTGTDREIGRWTHTTTDES